MAERVRPTVATVFAILHFVFGAFGLIFTVILGIVSALALFALPGGGAITFLLYVLLSLVATVVMIYAGITLIGNKSNAIQINLYYVFASVAVTVINVILSLVSTSVHFSAFGIILGLVYPALVFFLIVKKDEVIAFYSGS